MVQERARLEVEESKLNSFFVDIPSPSCVLISIEKWQCTLYIKYESHMLQLLSQSNCRNFFVKNCRQMNEKEMFQLKNIISLMTNNDEYKTFSFNGLDILFHKKDH